MKSYHRKFCTGAALMATLFFTAPVAHAHSVHARELAVTVQMIRADARSLTLVPTKTKSPREFVWYKSTRFIENNHFVDAAALKEGMQVKVYYHSPFFGKPFVTKVVWSSAAPPLRDGQQ